MRWFFFFFQAEDGIRDVAVTGVQTCALPISWAQLGGDACKAFAARGALADSPGQAVRLLKERLAPGGAADQIGRASCRERGEISVVAVSLKKKKKKHRECSDCLIGLISKSVV